MKRIGKKTFIAIFLLFLAINSFASENKTIKVEVLYFHATIRCEGCLMIEKYTKETIEQVFANELKSGVLSFASLDFMQEENSHYVEKFGIETQTLIVQLSDGTKTLKWKNLERIWDYVNDYSKFRNYIVDEVSRFLKEVENGKSKN